MGNNPISINVPLGDTGVVRWRSGFLGLGKKHESRYVNGTWINANNRKATNTDNKTANRLMNDYSALNKNEAFNDVTNKINTSETNVVFVGGKAGSTDPDASFRTGVSKELTVVLPSSQLIRDQNNDGYVNVRLNSQQVMGHELGHVYDMLSGKPANYFTKGFNNIPLLGLYVTIPNSEIHAMYYENVLRSKAGLPLRVSYGYTNTGGIGGVHFENNNAIIERSKNGKPAKIADLEGHSTTLP